MKWKQSVRDAVNEWEEEAQLHKERGEGTGKGRNQGDESWDERLVTHAIKSCISNRIKFNFHQLQPLPNLIRMLKTLSQPAGSVGPFSEPSREVLVAKSHPVPNHSSLRSSWP